MKKKKSIELYGDGIGKVDYVDHMGTDLTVVNSARVSFGVHKKKLDKKDKKLIKYLIQHRHTSTLEHNNITFRFTVPLYVRSQHHRHRTWSYNEISRRYTDFNIQFYEPSMFRTQHKSNRQASDPKNKIGGGELSKLVLDHHAASLELYQTLLTMGVCREQARGVLPRASSAGARHRRHRRSRPAAQSRGPPHPTCAQCHPPPLAFPPARGSDRTRGASGNCSARRRPSCPPR